MIESRVWVQLNLKPWSKIKSFSNDTKCRQRYGRNLSSIFHACLTFPTHHTKSIFHTNFEEPQLKIGADSLLNMYGLSGGQSAELTMYLSSSRTEPANEWWILPWLRISTPVAFQKRLMWHFSPCSGICRKHIFMYLSRGSQSSICLRRSCGVYFCDKWSCPVEPSAAISSLSFAGGMAENTKFWISHFTDVFFLFCSLHQPKPSRVGYKRFLHLMRRWGLPSVKVTWNMINVPWIQIEKWVPWILPDIVCVS